MSIKQWNNLINITSLKTICKLEKQKSKSFSLILHKTKHCILITATVVPIIWHEEGCNSLKWSVIKLFFSTIKIEAAAKWGRLLSKHYL